MPKPRMMFYTDGRHPLLYMWEPPMQKEELESAVDELAGTPIEAIMFCLGDGRTMTHDTKVGQLWGDNVDKWAHLIFRRAHQNARALIEAGNDPLMVICDRAHANGMLLYPTLLVQLESGVRGGPGYDIRSSDFRLDNKHLDIGAKGGLSPDAPAYNCADFMHEEVRNERFAIIEEVVNNYPVDGFELHLNFWPYYFHPNEVEEGRKVMTDWIRRVYETVKKSGADRELVITIPASIDDCLAQGMDPVDWMDRGIVDVLNAGPFSYAKDQDPNGTYIDSEPDLLEELRALVEAAKGSDTRIHAALASAVDTDRMGDAPIEVVRATACNYWAQGVDGLYLTQWFGQWPYGAPFYEKLRELPFPDIMAQKDKHYRVATTRSQDAKGAEPLTDGQLPAYLELNEPVTVSFTMTDDLPRWDKAGRVHEVLLRVRTGETTELDRMSFKLNGKDLPDGILRTINHMYKKAPRYRVFGYWSIFTLDREHWPVQGENTVEVTLHERDPDVMPRIFVRDVELETKYLMGKNFHRGYVDSDLGPYQHEG